MKHPFDLKYNEEEASLQNQVNPKVDQQLEALVADQLGLSISYYSFK